MNTPIKSNEIDQHVSQTLPTVDANFLFVAGQGLTRIPHANDLFDYITRTLRQYCNASVVGLARTTGERLIGQILSVDASSAILNKVVSLVGRGLRGAPIAVPLLFREGPGFRSALWEEAIYQPTDEPCSERPYRNVGKTFHLDRVYGFPFRYAGELHATVGVILVEGQSLTPSQVVTAELFLTQASLAARPFLEPMRFGVERHLEPITLCDDPYRMMFDQTDVAVFIVDNEVVVDCNEQVGTIFGAPPSQMVGAKLHSWVTTEISDRHGEQMQRLMAAAQAGDVQQFEMSFHLANGHRRVIEMRLLPLRLPAGKVMLQVIGRDCTERKEMEEALRRSEARYRELFETIGDGIAIFDDQLRIIDCNQALLEMLGYDHVDELRGVSGFEVSPPDYHELVRDAFRGLGNGTYSEYEIEFLTRTGGCVLAQVRIGCRRDSRGQLCGGWALLRDISDVRRMENEVAQGEKSRLLGELAAAISHEIRNPLTTVRGFTQLLASRLNCSPEDKEIYQLMLGEVDSATTIIRDFLDMARPSGPKRELLSLTDLLQSLVRVMESQALIQRVEITSQIDPDLKVIGDPTQLRQVFVNLIQNALQAMPEGGQITISAHLVEQDAVVRITDTGIGISPANLERIGRPFFTTRQGGTGLGLATCYRIIRAHAGKITVQSELGQGTEFAVHLPTQLHVHQ